MTSFEIRNTDTKGKGLFSLIHFAANQVILTFKGKILDKKTVYELPDEKSALFLQIGDNSYLDLHQDMSLFINHSCNPNAMIKIISKTAFLISRSGLCRSPLNNGECKSVGIEVAL